MPVSDAAKLRQLDMEELRLRLAELDKEIYSTRARLVTKELSNNSLLRKLRRDYARLKTIINEKSAAAKA
jgi:large subunit ribosomal protein L29